MKDCSVLDIDGLGTYLRIGPIDVDSTQGDANHHNHYSFLMPLLQQHQLCCVGVDAVVAAAASDGLLLIGQPMIWNSIFYYKYLFI